MANTIFSVQSENKIACYNAGDPKTVMIVSASSTGPFKILGFSISFDGRSITAATVGVILKRMTTSGTTTAVTPLEIVEVPETIQTTAGVNATVEPIGGNVIDAYDIHPQSGYEVKYPKGEEPLIGSGDHVGVVVVAEAEVNCRVKMICEE